jgi:hypothetical protein
MAGCGAAQTPLAKSTNQTFMSMNPPAPLMLGQPAWISRKWGSQRHRSPFA